MSDKRQRLQSRLKPSPYIATVMKFVLILFVLIGITQAEDCTTTADCRHVTCPELDYILACDRTECSCLKKCSLRSDCQTTPHGPHNHCTHGLHCVDGSCKCGAY